MYEHWGHAALFILKSTFRISTWYYYVFSLIVCAKVSFPIKQKQPGWLFCLVSQSWPTLGDCMDCSLPGSSVHGILQERIPGWVAISFSRGSSRPRDQTWVSCIAGRFLWTISHNFNDMISITCRYMYVQRSKSLKENKSIVNSTESISVWEN